MIKKLHLIFLLALSGCAIQPLKFNGIQQGKITFSGVKVDSQEVAGYSYKPVTYAFTSQATSIKGEIGAVFGIEYGVVLPNGTKSVIEHRIVFPEPGLTNPVSGETQRYTSNIQKALSTKDRNMFFYRFDEQWEVVEGIWKFQVIVDGVLSLERKFTVE